MSKSRPRISCIAALSASTHAIGADNKLLWHLPDDLKRFKRLTKEHPVIMGRATFESIHEIIGGPLPDRTNIVVTRDPEYDADGAITVTSIDAALTRAQKEDTDEIFVIGGGQIYEAALPYTNRLYLTLIDEEKDGDTFFPAYADTFTREIERIPHHENGVSYTWLTLERTPDAA